MKGDGRPPWVLKQIIEMMFPFPAFSCFNFDARKFSIQSIDDTERKSRENSQPNAAKHKCGSCAATDDKSCNRNLVWRDWRFAKERDNRRFDWRMEMSGQVKRSVLSRIQNNALSNATDVCLSRRKTKWPHVPAHADDVIVNVRRVHDVHFTGLDLVFKRLHKWCPVRAREKENPCHQSQPARVLHEVLREGRRVGIDERARRVPGA